MALLWIRLRHWWRYSTWPSFTKRLLLRFATTYSASSLSSNIFKSPRSSSYCTSYDPSPPPLSFSDSQVAFLSNLQNVSTFQTLRTLNHQRSMRLPPFALCSFFRWTSALRHILVELLITCGRNHIQKRQIMDG